MTTGSASTDAKVMFHVPNGDGSQEVEVLRATRLGGDRFRIDNSPFWAYGVSWQDVVLAPYSEADGFPLFMAVLERSGNRTVRVALDPPLEPGNESAQLFEDLVALGCSYASASRRYVSVNIPPAVALDAVRAYLIGNDAVWEHADPTYASLYPDEA